MSEARRDFCPIEYDTEVLTDTMTFEKKAVEM